MSVLGLSCTRCNAQYPIEPLFYGCPACQKKGVVGALDVAYDYAAIAKTLDREAWTRHSHSIWRFKDLLPVSDPAYQISLGEGNTALVQPRVVCETAGMPHLYIKNETTNPTWAFKDRFHAASLSMAKMMGYRKVIASTTGNHGASTAAYASAGDMDQCVILCHPESSVLQRNMIRMYGGHGFVLENRFQYLETFVKDYGFYPSTTMEPMPVGTPFGVEGYKTIAFEVYTQLGGRLPDRMFFPVSAGDVLYGPWKGWLELRELGMTDRVPAMHAVQAEGCNPYVLSFRQQSREMMVHPDPHSMALSIRDDMGGRPALQAIYDSDGDASDVTEDEIVEAVHMLARSGYLVEPSSAASVAGAVKAGRQGRISRDDTVVCVVTGAGAKWPEVVEKLVPSRTPVEPTWDEIRLELGL